MLLQDQKKLQKAGTIGTKLQEQDKLQKKKRKKKEAQMKTV